MQEFLKFLVFFLIITSISVILGVFEYYKKTMRLRKFRRIFSELTYPFFLTICTWVFIIVFIFVKFSIKVFDIYVASSSVFGLIFMISTLAILRLEEEYKLSKKVAEWPKTATAISGVIGLVVTVITSAVVDETISNITLSNAAAFQNAQRLLLIVFAPLVWIYLMTIIALMFYFYHSALLTIYALKQFDYFNNLYKSFGFIVKTSAFYKDNDKVDVKYFLDKSDAFAALFVFLTVNVPISHKKNKDNLKYFLDKSGVFAALLVFISFVIEGVPSFWKSNDFKKEVPNLIVFASFHVPAKACKNILYKDSAIAFTWDDNISVATPVGEGEYFFYVDTCERPIKNKE